MAVSALGNADHALTLYLARELAADGITVNAVAPGPIASAMTADFPERLRSLIPVGRMGTGRVYCGYRKSGSSSTITLGVFASGRRTGLAFCRTFHPGKGFRRDV